MELDLSKLDNVGDGTDSTSEVHVQASMSAKNVQAKSVSSLIHCTFTYLYSRLYMLGCRRKKSKTTCE